MTDRKCGYCDCTVIQNSTVIKDSIELAQTMYCKACYDELRDEEWTGATRYSIGDVI